MNPFSKATAILLGSIFWIVLLIYFGRSTFLRTFDYAYYGKIYSESQYILGPLSRRGIGDDGLYAYAGYYYLLKKGDISSVNFEHPPLGKYLIGVSIALFENERVINIFYFGGLLIVTYELGVILLKNRILASFAPAILSFDSLFTNQLFYSLLDLPFALFFVLAVVTVLKGQENRSWFLVSNIAWGVAFSIRFFPSFVPIYCYILFWLYFNKSIQKKIFYQSAVFIPGIYLLTHIAFFFYHPSFFEFMKHKIWMLSWFTGTTIYFGNIWRNIFTGFYFDPSGVFVANTHWNIILPVIFVLALASFKFQLTFWQSKKGFVYGLCLLYLLYVTFLTNGLQKFIMPVYPLIIVLALGTVEDLHSIIRRCRKVKFLPSRGKS
ncbi:hypothetical protein HYW55_03475 [Candidatus Gottesmanbacteria bacterium]|nr:hypothetical protein [Candidatus Gottesmanbacteria bacterium]